MPELGDCPFGQAVALGAVFAEKCQVSVFSGVATNAVEGPARGAFVKLTGDSNTQPGPERFERCGTGVIGSRRVLKRPRADLGEFHVVHRNKVAVATLMLDVTCSTLPDGRVEGRRLTTKQSFVVRMAGRALRGCHADVRFVA